MFSSLHSNSLELWPLLVLRLTLRVHWCQLPASGSSWCCIPLKWRFPWEDRLLLQINTNIKIEQQIYCAESNIPKKTGDKQLNWSMVSGGSSAICCQTGWKMIRFGFEPLCGQNNDFVILKWETHYDMDKLTIHCVGTMHYIGCALLSTKLILCH